MFRNSIARFTKNCTTSSKLCAKLYLNSSFLSSNNVSLNGTGTLARNSSTSSSVGSESWNWIPPRKHGESNELSEHDVTIPVIKNQLLTTAEIEKALELQGGKNIVSMDIKGNLDTIKQFVIVTGRSSRHMRKMADTIVSALKSRNLRMAPGYTGVEGDKDDDWMVVDCHDIVVNFMLANTRKALNIEDHWSSAKKPLIDVSPLNSREYDERFDELLEQYPIPSDYGAETNNSTPSIDGQDVMVDSDQDRDVHDVTKAYQNNVIMEPFAMKSLLKHGKEKPRGGKGRSEQNSKNAHNGDYVHQEGERAKRVGRKKSSIRRK